MISQGRESVAEWLESQTPNHKVVGSNPLVESNTAARHNWQICLKIDAMANPSHVRRFGETNERVRRWTSQDNLVKHRECGVRCAGLVTQCHARLHTHLSQKLWSVQHKLFPSINKSKVQVVRQTTIPGVVTCEHSYVESDGRVHHTQLVKV